MVKVAGMARVKAKLAKLPDEVEREFALANRENAELIVDTAKVLIPEKSGKSRLAVRNTAQGDAAQLIDFGPKAKVIEGERGPRPFVNPALMLTRKRRKKRNRKAIRNAAKKV